LITKVTNVERALSLALWRSPVIPALGRLRQEDREFEITLGYRVRPISKNKTKFKKNKAKQNTTKNN
jgi:hypothetical protein